MIITSWAGTNFRASTKVLVIIGLHILCKIKCEIYMQSGMFSWCIHIIPISINRKYMCLSKRKYTPLNSQTYVSFWHLLLLSMLIQWKLIAQIYSRSHRVLLRRTNPCNSKISTRKPKLMLCPQQTYVQTCPRKPASLKAISL